jgi:hypothetical protein
MVNQAKLRSYSSAKRYKYGFEVPRNYEDAICIHCQNTNTKWQDAVKMELESVHGYNVFIDKGSTVPAGYRKISVHLVFDVKHDGVGMTGTCTRSLIDLLTHREQITVPSLGIDIT